MPEISITQGKIEEWAEHYTGEKFHALLCDPPYHLQSIVKRFGKPGSAPAKHGTDGVFVRASAGFMGQSWDGGDVAFRKETWQGIGEHLHPGAFGFAFASARGFHRMAVAIEDAGFVIHPAIFGWAYSSGFPKATNIGKAIEREGAGWFAGTWAGHRYGLQALKPALEPIIVFQKPYDDRPFYNIIETGAGGLNIDAGRIASGKAYTINTWNDGSKPFGGGAGHAYTGRKVSGRWPANLVLDSEAAVRLDKQSGEVEGGGFRPPVTRKRHLLKDTGKVNGASNAPDNYGDDGGASRFFFNFQTQSLEDADPVIYCPKVSVKERNAGLLRIDRNEHPSLKPLALTKYLAGLLLPPPEYRPRRILVPFSGVASEAIGAYQAGWEQVIGVEMKESYIRIARARVKYWMSQPVQLSMFESIK